jgi:hypothetical protein
MGREVRRVPADWHHPNNESWTGREGFKPLHDGDRYQGDHDGFIEKLTVEGLQAAIDYYGQAPDQNDYMPQWRPEERTHFMMYETTSEGTPISPAFETPEELARWLADTGASSFADMTATYEQWLSVARGGWAPSAVTVGGRIMSGVEALSDAPTPPNEHTKGDH